MNPRPPRRRLGRGSGRGAPDALPPVRTPPASCRLPRPLHPKLAQPPIVGLSPPTAGDPWPIARGLFARSRLGQPIGAAPPPGRGRERGGGGEGGVPGDGLNLSQDRLRRSPGIRSRGEEKGVLGSSPRLPPLEAQRAGALANGFLAGHLRSE